MQIKTPYFDSNMHVTYMLYNESTSKCETIYLTERVRDNSGRFVVPLPFMESGRQERFLGSRQMALRRLQNLERKLQINPALNQAYSAFMSDYESLGHMSIAPSPGDYFIPHHPVFKGDVATSKIRVYLMLLPLLLPTVP